MSTAREIRMRRNARKRRARLKKEGFCINGRNHGKATHGNRCASCRAYHRGLRVLAQELRVHWLPKGQTKHDAPPTIEIPRGHTPNFSVMPDIRDRAVEACTSVHADLFEAWRQADRIDELQSLSDLTVARKLAG